MSVKILGGVARGFLLATPRAESTRPTSILIRRKLFDWRQNLEGFTFIDLCAGSGAMGFEALSRGADRILVNDNQRGAFLTLKENSAAFTKAFKFEESLVHVSNLEARAFVQKELKFQLSDTTDCVLFLDPPYEDHKLYFDVLALLKDAGFAGEVWLEADRKLGPKGEELTRTFHTIIKKVEQGDHFVVVGKLI